ncbi:YecA family protein [Pseudomonas sp. TCU-HL1]|uniref:YecA family protein n=1 Tax=Pseudomonas sp. TCU-HL1 TaxID=1856685 RepID=UPI0008552922|nr:SEC-C domain-containing protein [Pseudomonas sp. TCU-HL1]AOE85883.1 hypothetical protein THL1_3335 [Pseudomonas sp. TCU-HL1]
MTKSGRNAPCPCGSGKKYKKCHGDSAHLDRIAQAMAAIPRMHLGQEAKEHQRIEQQGLGKPILAAKTDSGYQFVAVRNRLFHSKKWTTFHDFLVDYLSHALGVEWANAELKKPLEERHPIWVWYHKLCEQQQLLIGEPGTVASAPMTGAVAAFMHLAYDLYALDHNAELQAKLIGRLRNLENFAGARYEIQVAATLVRAGFTLAFENEDDRRTSHCEFTATSTHTGKQFSVEAKRAESRRVPRQLVRALQKAANHTRIVFIDLNSPDPSTDEGVPAYMQRAFDLVRRFEVSAPEAQRLPPAYVFLTNTPWEYHLDSVEWGQTALADGFRLEDFKSDHVFPSLRAAINGRQAHIDMHKLLKSMRSHSSIPSTFDGDNPELAFVTAEPRLIIGNRYVAPDTEGGEVEGVLSSAVVMEQERVAYCALNTFDGRGILFSVPLSEAELKAWKRHPETFFGEISRNCQSKTPLDMYDFLMETYHRTPKEKLLEFLAGSGDVEQLSALSQPELASIHCERLAVHAFANKKPAPPPLVSRWRRKTEPRRAAPSKSDDISTD